MSTHMVPAREVPKSKLRKFLDLFKSRAKIAKEMEQKKERQAFLEEETACWR